MRIRFDQTVDFQISSASDIERLIPTSIEGVVLNYGQGEGQFQLGETVWGIYTADDGSYHMQYEEGICEWPQLDSIVRTLLSHLNKIFGDVSETIYGVHEGKDNV